MQATKYRRSNFASLTSEKIICDIIDLGKLEQGNWTIHLPVRHPLKSISAENFSKV